MYHVDGAQKQGFVRSLPDAFGTLGCGSYFHFFYDVLDNAIVLVEEVLLYVLV